jgi:hypothetical protein
MMGMSVDGYYEPNDVKKISNDVEEEGSIEGVANQSVDKDTLRHIEGMREFFKNNKEVAGKLDQYRKQLFISEYSTNDADLRFADKLDQYRKQLFISEYSTNDADLRFADKLDQYRKQFFTSEYSTNDADLGFAERLKHVEDEQNKIQQKLNTIQRKLAQGLNSGIEQKFGDSGRNRIFPHEQPIFKPNSIEA